MEDNNNIIIMCLIDDFQLYPITIEPSRVGFSCNNNKLRYCVLNLFITRRNCLARRTWY